MQRIFILCLACLSIVTTAYSQGNEEASRTDAGQYLPENHLSIELFHLEETKRRVVLRPYGRRYTDLLADFKESAFDR